MATLVESYQFQQNQRFMIFLGQMEALDEMLDDGRIDRPYFVTRSRELLKNLQVALDQIEVRYMDKCSETAPTEEKSTVS